MTGCEKFDLAIKEFGVDYSCEYFGVQVGTKLWHLFDNLREQPKNKEVALGYFCARIDKCHYPLDTYCEYCHEYKRREAK